MMKYLQDESYTTVLYFSKNFILQEFPPTIISPCNYFTCNYLTLQ